MTARRATSLLLLLALTVVVTPVYTAEDLPRAEPDAVGLSADRLARLTDALQAVQDEAAARQ